MTHETWLPVVGCPTHKVSDRGRILGPRGIAKGYVKRAYTGRPVCVVVSPSRVFCSKRVHRLVLEAFVGPQPEGMEGCHNDGNPLNNRLDNLRWDTHAGNRADMLAHGTVTKPPVRYGEAHHNTTLTDKQVDEIRAAGVKRGEFSAVGRAYGVSHQTIRRIMGGLTRRPSNRS